MRYDAAGRRNIVLVGIGLCAVVAVSGCAASAPPSSGSQVETLPPDNSLLAEDQVREQLTLPPVDLETMEWLDRLQGELDGDANFGSPAISDDRRSVTVVWYGAPSVRLEALVAEAPEKLTVIIQPAGFRPGELSELARRAVTTQGLVSGVQVSMGGAAPDASGIMIGIVELPAGRSLEQLGSAFAQALQRPDVPVAVEISTIVPVNG